MSGTSVQLSIIIPTREEEKAIAETIAQLQTLAISHEVIVSDGASTDATVERARNAGAQVVVFDGSRPHNASIGRNDGAHVASGEILCFIDADTLIPKPNAFFTRALTHFENPAIVGVCAPQRAHPELETCSDRISFGLFNLGLRIQNNVLHVGEASGKCMLVRASVFNDVHGFREDLMTREDGDFFNRISKKGITIFDSSLMVYHGARRAHAIGWWRLWPIWMWNTFYVAVGNKAHAKDWTPVR